MSIHNVYKYEAYAKRMATKERAARRSAKALASLTHDEYESVRRYMAANGRTWKAQLNAYWMNGKNGPNVPDDEGPLRSVRNKIGPSGLAKLRITRPMTV